MTGFLKFKDNKAFYDGQMFFVSKNLTYNQFCLIFILIRKENIVQPLWLNLSSLFTGVEEFNDNMDAVMKRLQEEKLKLIA